MVSQGGDAVTLKRNKEETSAFEMGLRGITVKYSLETTLTSHTQLLKFSQLCTIIGFESPTAEGGLFS